MSGRVLQGQGSPRMQHGDRDMARCKKERTSRGRLLNESIKIKIVLRATRLCLRSEIAGPRSFSRNCRNFPSKPPFDLTIFRVIKSLHVV